MNPAVTKTLWTPEVTLRLRDTSGRSFVRESYCIRCGTAYQPGRNCDPGSAMCPACAAQGSVTSNDTHPEVTGLARCIDRPGEIRCLLCAKPYDAAGATTADQICPVCRSEHSDSAKLVCAKCNITICRLLPKRLDSGFIIRPGAVLHSSSCNICDPGLTESSVIEAELWTKTQRPKKTYSSAYAPKPR